MNTDKERIEQIEKAIQAEYEVWHPPLGTPLDEVDEGNESDRSMSTNYRYWFDFARWYKS